jgi:hypothetical protein
MPIAITKDPVGEIELRAIKAAIFLDMRLVVIGRDGNHLDWLRHLRGCDVAQIHVSREKMRISGREAAAQARKTRALRQ